jgi:hypothetical protein
MAVPFLMSCELIIYLKNVTFVSFSGAKLVQNLEKTQKVALNFAYFLRNSKEMSTFAPQIDGNITNKLNRKQ